MKTSRLLMPLIWSLALLLLVSSCKKKEEGLAPEIQRIVPKTVLDDVRGKGMQVNEGQTPPSLEGVYIAGPFELLSPYSVDDSWKKGRIIPDYKFRLYNQSSDKKTIKVDFKNNGNDQASGLGSFVSGKDNKFTIFAEVVGTGSGVDYKQLIMISGEITSEGIKNFQYSLYITEKSEGPQAGALIPVNSGRIWFDNDQLAVRTNSYRLAAATDPPLLPTLSSAR